MNGSSGFVRTRNQHVLALDAVPRLSIDDFRRELLHRVEDDARLVTLFAARENAGFELWAVLAGDGDASLHLGRARLDEPAYPALSSDCPAAHLFEREIFESLGVEPRGHPWLKPVRFPAGAVGVTEFYRVEGEDVHEVAVGPVHAGVIEPGHFRFQCHGEQVVHLEISLGYQHRGVERALARGPNKRTIHYVETLAGDTSIGHATAYCYAVEALASVRISARAHALRAIALELERLANHTGDLGALAGDVGFLPTASYCGRLRGDFLNQSALLSGSRFGRGLVRPGGVAFDLDANDVSEMSTRLETSLRDVENAIELLWDNASVQARFESTGVVPERVAEELGLVGYAARASGVELDVRRDHPWGLYRFAKIPVSVWGSGDVFARARVRWMEIRRSAQFVLEQLEALPRGEIMKPHAALAPSSVCVSLVEGWRGEICHVALTDPQGRFASYKVVDPSFHNWMGLALALRDQQISDFPLCNKSFDLSYSGHDL